MKALPEIIEREMERHPHNRALLEAFRPVIMQRNLVLDRLGRGGGAPFVLDEIRFRGGVPVMEQHHLFQRDDPWTDIALAVISAMKEGMPSLGSDLGNLEKALQEEKIAVYDYFQGNNQEREKVIDDWAGLLSVSAPVMAFTLNQVSRIVLEKRAEAMEESLKDIPWEKGYCLICGSFPSLAVIGEKIGERRLHCSGCGHNWRFSRVICPYCEHEGQEGMNFFLIEDNAQETAFTCDRCKRYLVTLHRVSDLNERDLDVSAIGLVHLDVIMQKKNFLPMAVTAWNQF